MIHGPNERTERVWLWRSEHGNGIPFDAGGTVGPEYKAGAAVPLVGFHIGHNRPVPRGDVGRRRGAVRHAARSHSTPDRLADALFRGDAVRPGGHGIRHAPPVPPEEEDLWF